MKRRDFGLLAGSTLAGCAAWRPAMGQVPDAALLGTKLTPLGAERAGNEDGSIPPWTGGLTSPALAPDVPVVHKIFADERPLYEVNQGNLA